MPESSITKTNQKIFLGNNITGKFIRIVKEKIQKGKQVYFVTDNNTLKHCFPVFNEEEIIGNVKLLNIESGEENKNLTNAQNLWLELLQLNARKNCLIINLGGGVISDLGGFVASCYKRGVDFINVPTTLLGMIDASVGGKTAVNLDNTKNQIGLISFPEAVYVYPGFLKTLDITEVWSGVAEMIKIALVANRKLWDSLQRCKSVSDFTSEEKIFYSVETKLGICEIDPQEKSVRKILNFGHTIGHALESLTIEKKKTEIKHGFAVAAGIICETYISQRLGFITKQELDQVAGFISDKFAVIDVFGDIDISYLLNKMQHDKKKTDENISFSLLSGLGNSCYDQAVDSDLIKESIVFYNEQYSG